MIETVLAIAALIALAGGMQQWFVAQQEYMNEQSDAQVAMWQQGEVGWTDQLLIQAEQPDLEAEATRHLPTSGAAWIAVQPGVHALSFFRALKPFADLRGYDRSGLGLPIEVAP